MIHQFASAMSDLEIRLRHLEFVVMVVVVVVVDEEEEERGDCLWE